MWRGLLNRPGGSRETSDPGDEGRPEETKLGFGRRFGLWALLLLAALFFLPTVFQPVIERGAPMFLKFDLASDRRCAVEVFWDQGRGLRQEHSEIKRIERPREWRSYVIRLPGRSIDRIRIDPIRQEGTVLMRSLRIESLGARERLEIRPDQVLAGEQIASITDRGEGVLRIQTVENAWDPQLELGLDYPLRKRYSIPFRWFLTAVYAGLALLALFSLRFYLIRYPFWTARSFAALISSAWMVGFLDDRVYQTRAFVFPLPEPLFALLAFTGTIFLSRILLERMASASPEDAYSPEGHALPPSQRRSIAAPAFLLGTGILFGTVFVFLTPPYQAPDEYNWFYRAYSISEGQIFPKVFHDEEDGVKRIGAELPAALNTMFYESGGPRVVFRPHEKAILEDILELRSLYPDRKDRFFVSLADTTHGVFPYVPQALGIVAARSLGLGLMDQFYAGRLANLLVVMGISVWTIFLLPRYRWLWVVVILNPVNLFLIASNSHDPLTHAVALLCLALILRLREGRERVGRGDAFQVLGAFLVLLFCKFNYIVLLPLTLLIRREQFVGGGGWLRFNLVIWAGVGVALAILMGILSALPSGDWGQAGIDRGERLRTLLFQPLDSLGLIWHSLGLFGAEYLRQLAGVLGWLDTEIGKLWRSLWWTALVLAFLAACHRPWIRPLAPWERAVTLGTAALGTLSVLLIFFIVWTLPTENHLMGVQGRYFLVFVPLVWVGLSFTIRGTARSARLCAILCGGLIWLYLFGTSLILYERYWVPIDSVFR